jgi:hypothetical protein
MIATGSLVAAAGSCVASGEAAAGREQHEVMGSSAGKTLKRDASTIDA